MILLSKAFVGFSCCLLMLANKREAAWDLSGNTAPFESTAFHGSV
jgi:hypothetical protein